MDHDDAPLLADEPLPTVKARLPGPGLPMAIVWLLVFFGVQLIVGVVGAVVVLIAKVDLTLPLIAIIVTGNLVVAALIVGFTYGSSGAEKLAVRSPGLVRLLGVFALTFPLMVIYSEFSATLADALKSIGVPNQLIEVWGNSETMAAIGELNPTTATIGIAIFGALFPAIGEELLFRGFIGRGLVARWGRWRGVLITSALFGAMHVHPFHALLAGMLGVVLHAVYLWTRSLFAPMLLHAVNNFAALELPLLIERKLIPWPADDHVSLALILTSALATGTLAWLLYRYRVHWARPDGTEWSPGFATAETPPPRVDAHLASRPMEWLVCLAAAWLYGMFVFVLWCEFAR